MGKGSMPRSTTPSLGAASPVPHRRGWELAPFRLQMEQPRLPPLLMPNEPLNSLHPDLLLPLARLIRAAAARTQVWVVAHTPPLERAAWRWPAAIPKVVAGVSLLD
jgi:hypothetical protein